MSNWTDQLPYPTAFVPALLADTWNRHLAKEEPVERGKDGFPIFAGNPRRAEHRLITSFLVETWRELDLNLNPKNYASGRAILDLDDRAKVRVIIAIVERFPWFWKTGVREARETFFGADGPMGYEFDEPIWRFNLGFLLVALLRSPPAILADEFLPILNALPDPPNAELLWLITPKRLVRLVETLWPPGGIPRPVAEKLREIEADLRATWHLSRAEDRNVMEDFAILLGRDAPPVVQPGEAWADAALADLKKMGSAECAKWFELLGHCQKADGSKPTKKWSNATAEMVNEIGRDEFKARALGWFELVALPRTIPAPPPDSTFGERPDPNLLLCEQNVTVLRGLVWCFAGWKDPQVSSALSALAEVCFKKVRWLGPRCPRVGNACLYSLAASASEDAAAQLSRLDSTVKQPTAKKRIGKSLDAAATLTGQTREDLEEKSVPTFGLTIEGTLSRAFGDYVANLQLIQSREVEISWSRKDGKAFKAAPAEVKRDYANDLKDLQKLVKDIEKMLSAQRIRIERLLMTEREWDLDAWRQRYLEHPLLANITRRLIWSFKRGERTELGAVLNGKIVDVEDRAIDWLNPQTRVRLWHPIGCAGEIVARWREWLQRHEVCQPFKQAHREIYVLTDAELTTGTYSNRFAAQILGQHQFAALCKQRGWKYQFMGGFDFQSTPTLELPAWNLSAEFWVEPTGELAGSGVSRYLATDQVRFIRNNEPLALVDIPPLVFSEVMRDVDLFVGVGSIGNNPEWRDREEVEREMQAIFDAAGQANQATIDNLFFGDLDAAAHTRRDVLERLLPKLKIAGRCSLEEKFLRVQGDLRAYRIHLRSGNIQMEPNAQYLCIVPGQGASSRSAEDVFLPFEGDRTLSIILSKAFLLAADSKIEDPTIISQIKRR